jgi:hypothetical protein
MPIAELYERDVTYWVAEIRDSAVEMSNFPSVPGRALGSRKHPPARHCGSYENVTGR